jgi:8-oxo-dGTP diphosphatase
VALTEEVIVIDTPVLAAGAVLWRRRPPQDPHDGGIEIALVHRPKYDDWSHPKGKLEPGEDFLTAALREVREETGMECVPGEPLPTACYLVNGRPKEVRYWAAEAVTGMFVPDREVDRLLWLPPAAARYRLTHDRDRRLVDALLGVLRRAA